jgi:hypothetical protein
VSDHICPKHKIARDRDSFGGVAEYSCRLCEAERIAAYNAPGAANLRTQQKKLRRNRTRAAYLAWCRAKEGR